MSYREIPHCELFHKSGGRTSVDGIYRVYLGKRQKQSIWLVDGFAVARNVYPAFIMGGNDQRYRFNPIDDVWIDNRIGCEELEYTIAHELIERQHMIEESMTYNRAHGFGLELERHMRKRDELKTLNHARKCDPAIAQMYRMPVRKRGGLRIWIVDGPLVRKQLDGDFCFGAHDLSAPYIPKGELWLDSAMSCEQMHYSLVHQIEERRLFANGMAEHAYEGGLVVRMAEQDAQASRARRREKQIGSITYGVRKRGIKKRQEVV